MKNNKKKYISKYHIFRDLKFSQRMIVIYLIGSLLPLLGSSLYTNSQTRKMMIDLTQETQKEELSLVAASIDESMFVLGNVARLLSEDKQIKHLALTKYKDSADFFEDYNNLTVISNYLNYYQQDISDITIYVDNDSIEPQIMYQTDSLAYLGDAVRLQSWYKKTARLNGSGYWSYTADSVSKIQSLRVTRAVRDKEGKVIAVIAIMMQNKKTSTAIQKRSVNTLLLYNDNTVVCSNFSDDKITNFLLETISRYDKASYSKKITSRVEEYLMTYQRVEPDDSTEQYSLVSVQNYQDILSSVTRISFRSFGPEIAGIILSMLLIFGFAIMYQHRINLLRDQMHRVAQGEYDKVEKIEGHDEIGELYTELEDMMGDIQKLMGKVVEEQVQKEKMHTRQKEVEFKMLASQINPHFLYNTLETIRMKAMVNKQPEIEELVKMLAKIMRYNIQVTDQMVTLKSEIQLVAYYLKIQNYRFGDRITSEIRVDEDVDMQAQILPLIIQPFVENAFVHGLEERDSDGSLIIHVSCQEGVISIHIKDNGVGMDYFELGKLRKSLREENVDRNHIGVHNVNQRIKIQYGEEYGVYVESKKKIGTKVTLRMPYEAACDGKKNDR